MSNKQKALTILTEYFTKFINDQDLPAERKAAMVQLVPLLLEPVVVPKALNITYATIKYWESKNYLLFPVLKEVGEWRKFTMLEYLWANLITRLSQMGCTLDIVMPKVIYAYTHQTDPNCVMEYKANEEVETICGINAMQALSFFRHIFSMLERKGKHTLHLFSDGTILFAAESGRQESEVIKAAYETAYKTGITLCLSDLVRENFSNTNLGELLPPATFNECRAALTEMLNKKEVKEVTVRQNEGKIYQIEATEKMDITNMQLPMKSLITEDYQDIEVKTNKNKKVSVIRKTKRNFE